MKNLSIIILFSPVLIPVCLFLGVLRIVNKTAYDNIKDYNYEKTGIY